MQVPGGFQFRIPEIGFIAPPYQSFDTLVNTVHRVVNANAALAKKNGWPLGREGVALWVDRVQATICHQNGWNDYITTAKDIDPPKYPPPPGAHPAEVVAAGVKSLVSWFGAGARPVVKKLAQERADTCEKCEFNRPGDLGNWFSRSVSELIRSQVGVFKGMSLTATNDDKLGICDLCECPIKLKIHVPMEHIEKNMLAGVWPMLPEYCWMKKERTHVLPPAKN